MIRALKIGNAAIPIVATHYVNGSPSGIVAYQLPNNEKPEWVRNINSSAAYYWNIYKGVGYRHYDNSAWTDDNYEHHASRMYSSSLAGHINFTNVADEASFTLFPPTETSGSVNDPVPTCNWGYEMRTHGSVTSSANNFFAGSGIPTWPPIGGQYDKDGFLVAFRVAYSDVNYYNYGFIYFNRAYTSTRTGGNVSFQAGSNYAWNFNYWRRQGIDAAVEEVDIPDPEDPNDEGEPSDEDGGDGTHQRDYDPIPIPPSPTQGAATAGFVTLYKLHQASMTQFASDMFASSLWEAIKQFFGTPMDFLVGVNLLPFEPTAGPSFKPAYGPTAIFGHAYPTVANQYVDVDCGSVVVEKYWGSAFDFEPYTKIQIWLPYIGYRDLPVDEIMGSTVSVKYRCDCLTGDCVAFVYIGVVGQTGPQVERVIAQFYGNCAIRVPFGSTSYDSAISNSIALMGAAASAGLSAGAGAISETGKIGAGLNSGINAAGKELATNGASMGVVQGLKPNVHKGGAAGAATGYMSIQVPYLIRRIPNQNLPSNYKDLKGYPCNIGGILSDFPGLAVVDDIQLNNIPALEEERQEIISWLKGGVLV